MIIKTKVEKLDHQGRGIAYHNGKIVFVPNTLPGEEVEVKINKNRINYLGGIATKRFNDSPQRVIPACPYYFECGGCNLSHISYDDQIAYKKATLVNIMKKYLGIDIDYQVVESDNIFGYRNKVTLKIENGIWGYYEDSTHKHIPIKECLIASDAINKIIASSELFNINHGEIVIRSNYLGEILIHIISKEELKLEMKRLLKENSIVSIVHNNESFYGAKSFIEEAGVSLFSVDYNSFFQVNTQMLSEVIDILNRKTYRTVVDLYCGVGTLGLAIAKAKLYGIEVNESSINSALVSSELNDEDASILFGNNANKKNNFILGDSSKLANIDEKVETIIVDPPRSGISKDTIIHIIAKDPDEIIYMSCNPITLARDLKYFEKSYNIEEFYLLDMFPQTYHIESLVILKSKS